jgi:transposase InsO family protein
VSTASASGTTRTEFRKRKCARSGRRSRTLNVVDDFTRECLAIQVDTSLGAARVVRVLDRLLAHRGRPELIVCDKGPEFAGRTLDAWEYGAGVKIHLCRAPVDARMNAVEIS